MKIGPLVLFGAKPLPGNLSLAWWHNPHSLTWRWTLTLGWRKSWKTGFGGYRHNCGGTWILAVPVLTLQLSTQHPMWYRDLHRSDNDRRDREKYQRYLARSEAAHRGATAHQEHGTLQ